MLLEIGTRLLLGVVIVVLAVLVVEWWRFRSRAR
jgi:hypothetical protein